MVVRAVTMHIRFCLIAPFHVWQQGDIATGSTARRWPTGRLRLGKRHTATGRGVRALTSLRCLLEEAVIGKYHHSDEGLVFFVRHTAFLA